MIINYKDYFKENIALCLGFFDSVHIGHRKLIEFCTRKAIELDAIPTVFTFSNNPLDLLSKKGGLIYTYNERLIKLARCDIDSVIYCHCDANMMKTTAEEFESYLLDHFNISHIVVGADYTYGHKCKGNAISLKKFMENHGVGVDIIDLLVYNDVKIGSTYIRQLLEQGDIELANILLVEPYSVFGIVERGRGEGRKVGFPTANMSMNEDKVHLKNGVYATSVIIDDKEYSAVTNVGAHPTFNDESYNIETHILDFDDDIYGKTIEVYFFRYMRGISKFESFEDFTAQLKRDIANRLESGRSK